MNKFYTYFINATDENTSDRLTSVSKSNLYSFVIGIGILSFLSIGTFTDFGFLFRAFLFSNSTENHESDLPPNNQLSYPAFLFSDDEFRSAENFNFNKISKSMFSVSFVPEICNNNIDDDGDGLIDCADIDCLDCSTTCGDNDGDNVGDFCDLDDDNDGIPDAYEATGCYPNGNYLENTFFQEDFGAGTSVSSSSYVKLCYEDGTNPCALGSGNVAIGEYTIADTPLKFNTNPDWTNLGDHTGDANGRMLVMDASSVPDTFYIRPITGYLKNVPVSGSFWVRNTIMPGFNLVLPNITATIVDEFGTILNTVTTGTIPEDETWHEFSITADPGVTDSVFLILVNNAVGGSGNDLTLDDIAFTQFVCDTDSDLLANHLDLDSDNDGLYDAVESGHGQSHLLGELTGPVGTNGLIDIIETSIDSDTINYTISDSESTADGIYDAYELDADGDNCFDTAEESISDTDNDGIAGAGTPTVNPANGLVSSITYAAPANNFWQNQQRSGCMNLNVCYVVSDGRDGSAMKDTLFTFNPNTGAVSLVGPTETYGIESMALDPVNNIVFACNSDTIGTINILTGLFTPIAGGVIGNLNGGLGIIDVNDIDGLTYDTINNILWASERDDPGNDLLFQIDPATGQFVPNAFGAGVDYFEIVTPEEDLDDIAIGNDGTLYGISNEGSTGNQRLGTINKTTGIYTEIGDYGVQDVEGLTFSSTGQLLASTGSDGREQNNLYSIDPTTAEAVLIGNMAPASDVEACACRHTNFTNGVIGDVVWADLNSDGAQTPGEPGVENVQVNLLDKTGTQINTTTTDAFGFYQFTGLASDSFSVEIVLPPGAGFSAQDAGGNDDLDSDVNTSTGRSGLIDLLGGLIKNNTDAGLLNTGVTVRTCTDGGDLLVSDASGNILRFDQSTGAIIDTFIIGMTKPNEMILGPDNYLYVSDETLNQIRRYSLETGTLIDIFTSGLNKPNGLAFGPDGNLYVNNRSNDEVKYYDPATGNLLGDFIPSGASGLDSNNGGIEFGPDGNLYVASKNTDQVLRYNGTTGVFIDTFVVSGSGTLSSPEDIAFGSDGNLYVISVGGDKVLRYNGSTGVFIDEFITSGSGGINDPRHMVFADDGNLYLSSTDGSQEVYRYNGSTGAFIDVFTSGLTSPRGMIFAPVPGCPEICDNGFDDDLDGLTDCADSDCTPISTILSTTDPTTCGGTDGCIDINVTGGEAPYTYNWSNGLNSGNGNTFPVCSLREGVYIFIISSASNCIDTIDVVLSDPLACSTIIGCLGEASSYSILGLNGGTMLTSSGGQVYGDFGYSQTVNSPTNHKIGDTGIFSGTAYVHSDVSNFVYNNTNFLPSGGLVQNNILQDSLLDAANVDALISSASFAVQTPNISLGVLGDDDNRTVNRTDSITIVEINSLDYKNDTLTLVGLVGQDDAFIINVLGSFDFSGSVIELVNVRPEKVIFNFPNASNINIDKSTSIFNGTILAPLGTIDYGGSAIFNGAIIGLNIDVHSGFNIFQKSFELDCFPEICNNTLDDDGDGLTDCADSDCTPSVSLTLTDDEECVSSTSLILSGGTPSGGAYTGNGVSGTNFDASSAGVGNHTITYTFTDLNGCSNTATDDITVYALPTVSLSLPDTEEYDTSSTLMLSGGLPLGGNFSGTGVTGTNFNATTAGLGAHTITYTFTDVNGCSNTAQEVIKVNSLPQSSCAGANPLIANTYNVWHTGSGGGLDFNQIQTSGSQTGYPSTFTQTGTVSNMPKREGGATYCHPATGEVLLYSDGEKAWDKDGNEYTTSDPQNKFNTAATLLSSASGTPLIVAAPGQCDMANELYIFFTDGVGGATTELYYVVVDVLNKTIGSVNQLTTFSMSEQINAVQVNCDTIWMVFKDVSDIHAVRWTTSGFEAPVTTSGIHNSIHQRYRACFNLDATRFAATVGQDNNGDILVCDFNQQTGQFTSPIYLDIDTLREGDNLWQNYGIAFSPDGSKLYTTIAKLPPSPYEKLFQFDLTAGTQADILASRYLVANLTHGIGGIQNAPDGRLYISNGDGSNNGDSTIHVVDFPNLSGFACNFKPNFLNTGGPTGSGLNNIVYGLGPASCIPIIDSITAPNPCSEILISINDCYMGSGSSYNIYYSLNGNPDSILNQNPNVNNEILLTGLGTGAYVSLYIQDAKLCSSNTMDIDLAGVTCPEVCDNNFDDDLDGLMDCADPDCDVPVSLNLSDTIECVTSITLELINGTPGGGVFTGNGVSGTNFDASVAGVGTHAITYTINGANGCDGIAVDSVTVLPLPTVSLTLTDSEECINNTILTLAGGSPSGGAYTGTGVSGGNFNAAVAGLGTHTITYTFTDANGCTDTATDNIEVVSLPSVSLSLTNDSDCVSDNSLALAGGSPAGGTYSGTGVTLTNFDASTAGAGVHQITYTYTDPATGCENSATDNIVAFALPAVSLTLPDTEDCVLNNTFALSGGLPGGGTYSGTGVSGTNFDATLAGLGTHTISYTYTDANGCTNTDTQNIEVVSATSVSLTLGLDEDCVLNNTLALSGGTPLGGTYSGTGVSGTNFNASGAGVGTHNIFYTYTDGNGCSNTDVDVITVYDAPAFVSVTPTNPTTCSGTNGSISILGSGGTGSYEYRLDSGTWQSGSTFSGLSAGSYNVFIRNNNEFCEVAFASNPVVLSDPASPTAEINLPSAGCVNGSNNFTATNAGPSATYSWSFGSGASPATAIGIGPHAVTYSSAGSKTVSLSVSLVGCVAGDSESFTVNSLPAVNLSLPDTEECVSSTVLSLSGGTPGGGTYSGTGVSGTNFNASAVGVGTHTITYTFTDANGCENSATDNIEVLALPSVSLTLGTDEECISSTTLALNGGSPSGGTYSGTGVSGNNFDASTAGAGSHIITYTYTDGNGCENSVTDNITVYDFPTINLVRDADPTTCGGTDGSITITTSGATGSFEYRLDSGTWQSGNTFSGLVAGSYNVFVRNSNDFCEIAYPSNPVVLNDPPATVVTTAVVSNYTGEHISCVGSSDGFATASGSGGTSPFTYVWSNGQTGDTLKNVVAGTYSVTATDALGCQGTQTVTLNDPQPLGVTATFTHVSCYGGFDGEIDVTATGGVGAYTYSWNDFNPEAFWAMDGSTDDITGNGHHAVSIFGNESYSNDAVDGNQSFSFDGNTGIIYDDDLFADSDNTYRSVIMDIKPSDLVGREILYEEGGSQNGIALRIYDNKLQGAVRRWGLHRNAYEMVFPNDGAWHQVGFVYDNGTFTLMIDGVMGTSYTTGFSDINLVPDASQESGLGKSHFGNAFNSIGGDGQRYIGLMDNVAVYKTALRPLQISDNFTDDGDRTGLPAGDYKVYVYDLNGCIDSVTLTLTQPDSLALTANISDVLCNGGSSGAIDLSIAGGVGPFTQLWSTGATSEDISGLVQNTYSVTVTDDNGCTVEDRFVVNEPAVLSATTAVTSDYNTYDVSCFGTSDGTASATPAGGTLPYTYVWSNGQTGANLINVDANSYSVTVTDVNSCTVVASVSLSNPPQITVSTSVTSSYGGEDISCVGASDGTASASASSGVGTYSYVWSNGQTGANLVNVVADTYTVTATDANGCTSTGTITLNDPTPVSIVTSITSDYNGANISCAGENDGSADALASGGSGPYSYTWSNGQTGVNLKNVGANTYTVTATDAFGCTGTQTVTLTNPSNVNVSINVTSDFNGNEISCNGGADGAATASASGGIGPYTYVWSTAQTGANLTNAGRGTYSVIATDANGCTSSASIDFDDPDLLNFTVTSADPSDCGVSDGIILISASGGIGTYEYSIDGSTWLATNSFSGLSPGTYFSYVRNTYGTCVTGPTAITVNIPEAPTIDNITIINPTTAVSTDGGILVSATGSGIGIEYSINGTTWQSSNLFSGLSVGSYKLTIRYTGFTCESSSPFTLIAGGGVVGQGGGENYCSDDLSGVQFVETYYIPYREDQVLTSLLVLHPSSCGYTLAVAEPVQTYVSIGVVEGGTVIYYDHWEDGYEPNLSFPIQSSTEVWGDGDLTNGFAPGYGTLDLLSAADIIILNNAVTTTTRQSVIDYDAGDKMGSRGNLSMTRLAWASGTNTLLAGALEVYPTLEWGTEFEIPVGQNSNVSDMFEYTAVVIMASNDSTIVNIDSNADGSIDITQTLNEGQSYLVNGGVNSGATVSASADVQVDLITGDICAGAEARFFNIKPTNQWSSDYYNPVATQNNGAAGTAPGNHPTYVHLYNPNSSSINVTWESSAGVQGSVSVAANGTNFIELPDNTGSHFYTTGNEIFYAIATIDSDPNSSTSSGFRNSANDWGFALVPESQVSNQITLVGFAPGDDPTYSGSSPENSAPVWLTAAYPSGSSSTGSITVCIDYNGDGGSLTDVNGQTYDATVVLNSLQNSKIYDPDGDQTGMQIWVCDGSDAIIAGAWGQDPATASGGTPAIDLGVSLPNGIPFATSKCVDLSKDYNSNGLFDECDEVIYTLFVRNSGALPLSTGSINLKDTLPSDLTYIENSTVVIVNGVVTNLTDDGSPASPFPLDEAGINYSSVIQPGDSVIFRFEAVIGDVASAKFITNVAHVSNAQKELLPEVSFPAQEPTGAILTGIPIDTSLMCGAIPSEPSIGSDIYSTNNCEEVDVIPQAGWSLHYTDSEETVSETSPATNAFDGDINTIWHSKYNGTPDNLPHEIQIDLGATYNVTGLRYLPRQSGEDGKIEDFEFYISEDGTNWGTAKLLGTWSGSISEEEEIISITRGRYVRLVATSEINGNPFTSIAELNILQCINYAPVTINFTETSTQTSDGSATDNCYEITRNWETIDHCGEVVNYTQVLTVIDTVAPTLVGIPSDVTVSSIAIPEAPILNCVSLGNVAAGKPTSQSTTSGANGAANAVDGDPSNSSISETNSELEAWWEVDLQSVYPIEEIEIWNRTDCCTGRLQNYYILTSDHAFTSTDLTTSLLDPAVKAYFQSAVAGTPSTISIDTTARFVRVQLQGTDVLNLAEVVVTPACVTAIDGCDSEVNLTYSEVNMPSGCSYGIMRTWEATDNCGNVTSQTQTIKVSTTLDVVAGVSSDYNTRDLSCSTASDGAATISVDGGVTPLTISWSNGQSGLTATNLSAGTYSVTVTDNNGCSAEDDVTLVAPPGIIINANITSNHNGEHISCFGSNDGSAFVNASGGTGAITYAWSSGQNTASATNLTAGTYTVTATDTNGCTATTTVTLNDPNLLTVSASITSDYNGEHISCPGFNDGEATATSSGGTGAITYNWNNSFAGAVNGSLISGKYIVTATDVNGCFAIDSVTLVDPTPITFSISTQTNPTLCEGTDGVIAITASGGMGTYQYRIGATGIWQASNTFSGLAAGTYDLYVRNSDGSCESPVTQVILIDPIPQSCPIFPAIDTICNTNVNVSLSVDASPDASGYTWTIPVGMIVVSGAGTNSIVLDMNELSTGSYDICVVTNSNCGDSPSCCINIELIECVEICNNGIDDDGDGNIDLTDDECLTCDQVYTSDEEYLQIVNTASGLAEDSLNAIALSSNGDALGLDPISQRFYYLEGGSTTPTISYIDPNTSNQINTGITIPSTAIVPAFGFNVSGLGYAISENGELYAITTNAGGSNIPGVNLLGNIGAATLGDLAVDNDGIIWAVLNSNELHKIDPTIVTPGITLVGVLTELTNFGGNEIESVAFNGAGQLLVGAGSNLYDIDIATTQGTLIGSLGVPTHDFASCAFPVFTKELTVSKTVAQTGSVAPGDTLDYSITISNTGGIVITGASFMDTIPDGTSYVVGSTVVNGTSLADVSGAMPYVNGGAINSPGSSSGSIITGNDVVITFRVVTDCCPGATTISNQGWVDYDGASEVKLSDDPTIIGTADPTEISISTLADPIITLAASNETIDCNTATNSTSITDWLASNGGATASVSCGAVNWTNNYTSLSDLCGGTGTATVTFTASNECGGSVNTMATFTIIDTIPPSWNVNPADITIECNGTSDPRGELSAWLANNGGGVATDLCGSVNITNDYSILTTTGCSGTGNATVTFTATDECSRTSTRTAVLTIVDTTAPTVSSIADITVECDSIPVPVAPVVLDSCDIAVDVVYNEVTVHHPNANWKSSSACSLLHAVTAVTHDDKGTPGDSTDDEMTFTISVIGQNTGTGWTATVNGTPISGAYYKTYEFGPLLSNGSILSFSIIDDTDGTCVSPVVIDAADF